MSVRSSLGRKRRMPATDKEVTSPTESRTALSDVVSHYLRLINTQMHGVSPDLTLTAGHIICIYFS